MLNLRKITFREIHLPLKEPFVISSGTETMRRILLLELTDADGAVGWGECVAMAHPNYLPETIDTAWLALTQWLAPQVLGQAIDGPEAITPLLDRSVRGHRMAKAALEMGAWALDAERAGVSLARHLGGSRRHVPTGISLGLQPTPEALAERAAVAYRAGYRKIKLKIKPGKDLDYVAAVRETLGPEAPLMVDANNAFTLDDQPLFRRLDAFGLMMIEQPLAWDDHLQHAQLQKHLRTPICLDESITTLARAQDMIALKSGRIINIKPGRVGGLAASKAIHDLCRRHAVPVWCGGMLESGIGRAHNVALASLPGFTLPGDLSPSDRYWAQDIVHPAWTMDDDGLVPVPFDQPGLGVEIDYDRIEDLTVRREDLHTVGA